jgi:hypothetical protein
MRIRILKQTSINGQPARVGDVIDAADPDAGILLVMGKAEAVGQDPAPVVLTPETAAPHLAELQAEQHAENLRQHSNRPRKPRSII